MLKRFYKSLFFSRRWYWLLVAVIGTFVLFYGIPFLFEVGRIMLFFLLLAASIDYVLLFGRSEPVTITRELSDRFSNGDRNNVRLMVRNQNPFRASLRII